MKIRMLATAVTALTLLAVSACASTVAGSPQVAAGGLLSPTTLVDGTTGADTAGPSAYPTVTSQADTSVLPTETTDSSQVAPTEDTSAELPTTESTTEELPPDTTELTETDVFPTGTDIPSSIPGLSADCNKIYGVIIFLGKVAVQDTPVTQDQVDAAFAAAQGLPAELQGYVTALKTASAKMVGKSGTDALIVLGTDAAAGEALTELSNYFGQSCKYGG